MGSGKKKLTSSRGEALMETIAALLVVVLAGVLFATMTQSAAFLNRTTRAEDAAFYRQLTAAEAAEDPQSGEVTIQWGGGSAHIEVAVSGAEGQLQSYRKTGGTRP